MKLYRNTLLLVSIALTVVLLFICIEWDDQNSNIMGNVITNTRATIIPTPFSNCSFHLHSGWNLVSFYCLGLFNDRSEALSPIDGQYTMIFGYDASDVNDPWKSYNPNLPNWTVQQLNSMDRLSGYWIYLDSDADYVYPGVNTSSSIQLYAGWNLVGYPVSGSRLVNDSLHDVSFTVLKTYDTSSDNWLVYTNNISNNTLSVLNPYRGYWINVPSKQTWSVDKT